VKVALVAKAETVMTGHQRYALGLYGALQSRGVDVRLVHPRSPVPGALSRGAGALGLDTRAFFHSYPVSARLGDPSLCHLAGQTLATLLLFQRTPPAVVTILDIIPYLLRRDPALGNQRPALERLFDRLAMRALTRAQALIAISEYTKRTVVKALGLPAERIHVVPLAIDREVFRPRPVPAAFRQKYGLEQDGSYVLYVGSEDPRKNLETLLLAFALVRSRHPLAQLLKVGAAHFAPERRRLLALVEHLDLAESVRFVDHVPEEELPLFYNAAHLLVLPSLHEGFGLPALEAMSCGTPVVASNRASLPEVVGGAGPLVNPESPEEMARVMAELLADEERRAEATQAGLAQAARFSLERQAAETLAVYQEVA
jgi:glycosyltransferase involved in cell wall biosynthesis